MQETLKALFRKKTTTAEEAVKVVRSVDRVYTGSAESTAVTLCKALAARKNELKDITLGCMILADPSGFLDPDNYQIYTISTEFQGGFERAALKKGIAEYVPISFSQIDIWIQDILRPRVAFLEVSLPDEDGYMSLSTAGPPMGKFVIETAEVIIVQINKYAPYVYGQDNKIHISDVDYVVYSDVEKGHLLVNDKGNETVTKIADYIIEQVPDGACIQLGLGSVSTAIGYRLTQKNDLGCHTELVSDSIMYLMQQGNINNSKKQFLPGKTVTGFAMGSPKLYEFLNHNENVYFAPFTLTNNPVNIAKNDNMISVNSAMCIDLTGQVTAENVGGKQYSGTGGQLDFVRGAQMSKGGKSFIGMTSSKGESEKRKSRIVPKLPEGSVVTTPRTDVQYVVTEYGCVNLKVLTVKDRARALISIAHPDDRIWLTEEAKKMGFL